MNFANLLNAAGQVKQLECSQCVAEPLAVNIEPKTRNFTLVIRAHAVQPSQKSGIEPLTVIRMFWRIRKFVKENFWNLAAQ